MVRFVMFKLFVQISEQLLEEVGELHDVNIFTQHNYADGKPGFYATQVKIEGRNTPAWRFIASYWSAHDYIKVSMTGMDAFGHIKHAARRSTETGENFPISDPDVVEKIVAEVLGWIELLKEEK